MKNFRSGSTPKPTDYGAGEDRSFNHAPAPRAPKGIRKLKSVGLLFGGFSESVRAEQHAQPKARRDA